MTNILMPKSPNTVQGNYTKVSIVKPEEKPIDTKTALNQLNTNLPSLKEGLNKMSDLIRDTQEPNNDNQTQNKLHTIPANPERLKPADILQINTQGISKASSVENVSETKKPDLFKFEKVERGAKRYHATFGNSPMYILNGINTDVSSAEGRYHQGFYLAEDKETCKFEALKAVNKMNAQFLAHRDNPKQIDTILEKIDNPDSPPLTAVERKFLDKMEVTDLPADELKEELMVKKESFEKELTWFSKTQTVDIKQFYQPKDDVDAILEFEVQEDFYIVDLKESGYHKAMMETNEGSRGTAKEMQNFIQSIHDGTMTTEELGLEKGAKILGLKNGIN